MNKQKKLIKRLGILFLLLIMSFTILSATAVSAAVPTEFSFRFDIPADGDLCRTGYSCLRATNSIKDAWGVDYDYGTESLKVRTYATFWLGIHNPNGINPLGSKKYNIKEGTDWHYLPAYAAASREYVYLYASDNSTSNDKYSAQGDWTPNAYRLPD